MDILTNAVIIVVLNFGILSLALLKGLKVSNSHDQGIEGGGLVAAVVILGIGFGLLETFIGIITEFPFIMQLVSFAILSAVLAVILGLPSLKTLLVGVLIIVLIIIPIGYNWGFESSVYNAQYLNSKIQFADGSQLFANQSLPINAIPIVSHDAAQVVATARLSDFGGNVLLADSEQIVYQGAPYWAFTIASTNTWAQNYEKGYVFVNAVNESYFEIHQQSAIGPALCGVCLSSIDVQSFMKNTGDGIGNWYPQVVPDGTAGLQVLYVVTLDQPQWGGFQTFDGGIVYNPDGSINTTYTGFTAPSYISQPWDRELLTQLAGSWASTNIGDGRFSYWAAGVLNNPASASRLQLDSDGQGINYQLMPYQNRTALMMFFSPANQQNSLAGIMLVDGTKITYYNMIPYNFYSPTLAESEIQSHIPTISGGTVQTAQPILYNVNGQFVYLIPYFFNDNSNVLFQGMGVVSAQKQGDVSSVLIQQGQTITQVRDEALAEFFAGSNSTGVNIGIQSTTVKGVVQHVTNVVEAGNSEVAIELNGTTYTATPPSQTNPLTWNDWYALQSLGVGDNTTLVVKGTSIVGVN